MIKELKDKFTQLFSLLQDSGNYFLEYLYSEILQRTAQIKAHVHPIADVVLWSITDVIMQAIVNANPIKSIINCVLFIVFILIVKFIFPNLQASVSK